MVSQALSGDALQAAMAQLAATRDVGTLFRRALGIAIPLTAADYAGVGWLQPNRGGHAGYLHTASAGAVEMDAAMIANSGGLTVLRGLDGPLRLDTVAGHPAFTDFPPGQPPIASLLAVALEGPEGALGHLDVGRRQGGAFTPTDEAWLTLLAGALSASIHATRSLEEVRMVKGQGRRLVSANLSLVRQLRPGAALQWAAHDVRTVVDADYAAVALDDAPEGGSLGTFVYSGMAQGAASALGVPGPVGRGVLRTIMLGRRAIRLRDVRDHLSHGGFPRGHPVMTSLVAAPIVSLGEVLGLLFATNKRSALEFTESDERFVAELAAELGQGRLTAPEPVTPDLADRLASTSRSLRAEMDATRSFLGSLSHELRGSISGIMVSAELINEPTFGLDEAQMRTVGARIHTVANNLLALVDNLLDLARLEAGRLDVRLQPVELGTVLQDVEAVMVSLAGPTGVSLELPTGHEGPKVLADPVRLRQVLINLLTNAVKFTAPGGRAWLEIAASGNKVVLAVCDTGRGIPAEELDRIFEPFQRVGGEHIAGVGLGLAICRRIVMLHDSKLEVASWPQVGSRFSFTLRVSREPLPPRLGGEPEASAPSLDAEGTQAAILIVEDDPLHRQSTSDILTAAGFVVRSVATRGAALESVAAEPPDLITLDVQLPDGDGLDIVDQLRAMVAPRPIAIVALSADRLGRTAERARLVGCDGFALKPIGARELLNLVRSALPKGRV